MESRQGFPTRTFFTSVFGLLIALPIFWYFYCVATQKYWDSLVETMCHKDGGVKVYEQAAPPEKYFDQSGTFRVPVKRAPHPGQPFKWEATPDDPYYWESEHELLLEGRMNVGKTHVKVIRTVDDKILGEGTFYSRAGGDFFVLDFHSSFRCPAGQGETTVINAIFGATSTSNPSVHADSAPTALRR